MSIVSANMLSFDSSKDKMLFNPPTIWDEIGKHDRYEWELIRYKGDSIFIKIDAKDKYFRGTFKVSFEADKENEQLYIQLKSDSTYLHASKILEDFDAERYFR